MRGGRELLRMVVFGMGFSGVRMFRWGGKWEGMFLGGDKGFM